MNKDVISKALYFTAGVAVGGGTVYFVVKKRYRLLAEEEIASVKDAFRKIADERVAKAEADWRSDQEGTEEEVDRRHGLKIVQNQEYETVSAEVPDEVETIEVDIRDLQEETEREVTVTFAESREQELDRDPNQPYEIDFVDFASGDNENPVFTYWEEDDTLTNEKDEIVDNGVELIGDVYYLLKSDERKKRGKALYVRNDRIGADFEIILDPKSYSKTILGLDEWHADDIREKVRTKKMRSNE